MYSKPKILFYQKQTLEFFVEEGNPKGGSAVEAFVWMKTLYELGFDVYQLQTLNDLRPHNCENNWVKIVKSYNEKIKRRGYWFWYRFPVLFKLLFKIKFDYVYTTTPNWEAYYWGFFCKILGIKHIIRIASDNITSRNERTDPNEIEKIFQSFAMADIISVQNNYQYKVLSKKYPSSNIFLLYNPIIIDQNLFKVKNNMEGYIAWVANFRNVKNMELLYEIALTLKEQQFKIAGEPLIPLESETELSIKKLKSLRNVEFVGSIKREKILVFFQKSKFLLNTSKFEGFSNTFLEAMITGTPILTTPNVNPDGIIDNFGVGLLYKDAFDLLEKLSSLSESQYIDLSTNCLSYVKKNHDHKLVGESFISKLN